MTATFHYDIHLPTHLVDGQKYPVLFTLHGKGTNEHNMYGLVAPLAEQFIIIGIRGHLTLGAGYQYYNLKSLGNPIREQFDDAVNRLQQFIAYATEKYPIDPDRRYMIGFSQGAILSMTLALTMGDQLQGIVAMNGYIPDFVKTAYTLASVKGVSFLITHGEYDSIFPIAIGRENAHYLQQRSPLVTFNTYPTDHGVSEQNQQDVLNWLRNAISSSIS